jgi:hypothetical protein
MADFPAIPLGYINLLQEIGHHRGADVVHQKNGGNSIRRMYTAHVHGCKSNMMVALYQGNSAEDVCCFCFLELIVSSLPFTEMVEVHLTICRSSVRPFVPLVIK